MVKLSRAVQRTADLLFPRKCALCGEVLGFFRRDDLCPDCLTAYRDHLRAPCFRCQRPFGECRCNDRYYDSLGFARRIALGFYREYDDPAGRLVYRLKREYDRDLQKFFARALASAILGELGERAKEYTVTYPPRSRRSVRKYGFDQAKCLSRQTAKYLGCAHESAFLRTGDGVQKKLSFDERIKNAAVTFALSPKVHTEGKKYILVDDVMTTGATLSALSDMLCRSGARTVCAATLFTTGKKKAEPKDEGLWFEEE